MIMEALLEGGWSNNDEESKDKSQDADDSSENSLVASILNKPSDDNQMVQSALNSQSVSSTISRIKASGYLFLHKIYYDRPYPEEMRGQAHVLDPTWSSSVLPVDIQNHDLLLTLAFALGRTMQRTRIRSSWLTLSTRTLVSTTRAARMNRRKRLPLWA